VRECSAAESLGIIMVPPETTETEAILQKKAGKRSEK
jgi:hypothetical protein